ncbi:MAG: hypothetical protein ACRC5V_03555 [Aeromonas sp.]
MFQMFTDLASWLVYQQWGLNPQTKLADALHFFVEDVSKIFALLLAMIYIVAMLRASLNAERVRDYLAGKHRGLVLFTGRRLWCDYSLLLLFEHPGVPRLHLSRYPARDHHGLSHYLTAYQ